MKIALFWVVLINGCPRYSVGLLKAIIDSEKLNGGMDVATLSNILL